MTIRKIALGACLLVSSTALAQDRTYTVKQGDTLSEIAGKFGVDTKAILHANNLPSANKLKLGQTLRIPATAGSKPETTSVPGEGYAVQSGDNDEVIAKKLGVTPKELRLANLGTNWTKLQIGQKLTVPTTKGWFQTMANHAVAKAQNHEVSKPTLQLATNIKPEKVEAPKGKVVQRTYTVRNGDNDWIIARRVGIKPSQLRTLNPGAKWSNLQIGTELKVPGTKVVTPAGQVVALRDPNLPKIRSRYAVITGDRVTLRRGPSMRFDSVTQVDQGTRVLVLDREGSWYKLRFPKGTEAWVRGDFLAPTKAPQVLVASNTKKAKTSTTKKSSSKSTYVASRPNRKPSRDQRGGLTRRPTRDNGRPLVTGSIAGGDAVERASGMLGVRYRYGAASRGATDCSGLTTQVYKSMGVKLPRTAREQSSRGQKVDKSGLKPGDLVFFKTRGSRVSHVGIYKGNGKFIHASSGKGKVMESSLNEGYYNRRYAGARRIVASKPTSKKADTKVAKRQEPKSTPVEPVITPLEPKTSSAPPDNGGKF